MRYKQFGSNRVSVLGFGAMRLPARADDSGHVDIDRSAQLLCEAFEQGINYVDTAFTYRGGESELAVAEALRRTKREVYVSTKFPLFSGPKSGDYTRTLEQQLKKLDRPYIDYYHFHALSKKSFDEIVIPQRFLEEARRAKEQGLIKHISFSFHDEPEAMRHIIDRADVMESVLCQYNIIDRRNEQMLSYAKGRGLGVAIMGPLGGGKFTIRAPLESGSKRAFSTPELAMRFLFQNPNVDLVLSGMKNHAMLVENISIASREATFSAQEQQDLERMIRENEVLADCYCTECGYCLPCPKGVNIPYLFRLLNYKRVDGLGEYARKKYRELQRGGAGKVMMLSDEVMAGQPVSACVGCGLCEKKCPQKLSIRTKFEEIKRELGD